MESMIVEEQRTQVDDPEGADGATISSQNVRTAESEQMVVQNCMAVALAAGQDAYVEESTIIVGAAGQTLTMNDSGAMVLAAGKDLHLTDGGAAVMLASGDLAVKNGGAVILVAAQDLLVKNHEAQSALLLAGKNVKVENGSMGAVLAVNATVQDNARILVELSPRKFVKAAITLAALPLAVASVLSSRLLGT